MRLANHANLSAEHLARVERELAQARTLSGVLRWGLGADSGALLPQVVAEVVTQDEYTHDVVVAVDDGLYLVFDTT